MKIGKKYIMIAVVIILIVGLIYCIYTYSHSNNNNNEKNKALSEIQYLENKFVNMFNSLNNIQYENYKIFSDKIDEKNNQKSQSQTSSSNSNSESEEENSNEETYEYNLKLEGTLNTSNNIDWKNLKNEVELIYTSLPTITLDLYQINLNKNDILSFNKDFDQLTTEINNEDKQNTLNQLTKLYKYLPNFLDNTNADKKYKIILKTKFHIFEAYSLLDTEDWKEIGIKTDNGINAFKDLLGTEKENQPKQYSINKCYIMLNELKNATIEENNEIFLIKYKNLLEEISNI